MPARRPVHTAESLVRRLKALMCKMGKTEIPEHVFVKATGIGQYHIRRIMGTYGALRQAAGLTLARNTRLTDDDLLGRLRDAGLKARTVPPALHIERCTAARL